MMGNGRGSARVWLMRASTMWCALWLASGAWLGAAAGAGAQGSAALSPRDLLARAQEAVKEVRNLHSISERSYPDAGRAYRQQEWEQAGLYRREDNFSTFVLGERWAVLRDRKSDVAMGALRRAEDDRMFLASPELLRHLDLGREASAYSKVTVSGQIEKRVVDGKEQLGVRLVQTPKEQRAREGWFEVTMQVWVEGATQLPAVIESGHTDRSGKMLASSRTEYQYNLELPDEWFRPSSVLDRDTVVLVWEHLRDLVERGAIASEVVKVGDREVLLEVRAVERLPRDHVLIAGLVHGYPEWLGSYLTQQEGRRFRDWSLAWKRAVLPGPWGGGGSGPPRLHFAMVFAPKGYGSRGISVPARTLTWRAWGLFSYPVHREEQPDGPQWQEEDLVIRMALPVPEGPSVVHEFVEELWLE
jgi:hypothetical protein